jgi:hypothetical protein
MGDVLSFPASRIVRLRRAPMVRSKMLGLRLVFSATAGPRRD